MMSSLLIELNTAEHSAPVPESHASLPPVDTEAKEDVVQLQHEAEAAQKKVQDKMDANITVVKAKNNRIWKECEDWKQKRRKIGWPRRILMPSQHGKRRLR